MNIKSHLKLWTVRWQVAVTALTAILSQLQDSVPEIKAVLTGKPLIYFIIFNAAVTCWLRVRKTNESEPK